MGFETFDGLRLVILDHRCVVVVPLFPLTFLSVVGQIYSGLRTSIFMRVGVRQRVSTHTVSTRGQCGIRVPDHSGRYTSFQH